MITTEEMKKLMTQMADFLKSKGLSNDEIEGAINIAKIESVLNGTYKNDNTENFNQ